MIATTTNIQELASRIRDETAWTGGGSRTWLGSHFSRLLAAPARRLWHRTGGRIDHEHWLQELRTDVDCRRLVLDLAGRMDPNLAHWLDLRPLEMADQAPARCANTGPRP